MTESSKEAALNKTLYALVKQVGLTPDEISQLKLADLKLAGQHPTINFVSPSTHQQKIVELDLDTHRSVVGWLVVRPDSTSELLFPGPGDEPIAPAEIEQATAEAKGELPVVAPQPQPESPSRPVTPVSPSVSRPVRPSFSNVPPPPPPRPGPFQPRPTKPPPAPPEKGAPRPGAAPPPPPESSSAPPPPPEADSPPARPPFTPGPSRPVPRQAAPPFIDLPAPESTPAQAEELPQTGPAVRQAPPPPLHRAQPKHKERAAPKPMRRREEADSPAMMPQTPEPLIPPVNVKPAGTISSISAEEAAQIDAAMKKAQEQGPPSPERSAAGPPLTQPTPEAAPVTAADAEATLVSGSSAEPITADKPAAPDAGPATPGQAEESPARPAARPTTPGVTTDEPKPPRWYRPEPDSSLPGPLGRTERPMAMSFGIGGLIVLLALCGICVTTGWILDTQSEDGLLVDLGLVDPTVVVALPDELAPTEEATSAVESTEEPALVEAPVSAVATPTSPPTNPPTSPPPTDTPIPTDTPLPTDTPEPTETPTPIPTDTPEPTSTPEPAEAPPEAVEEPEPAPVEEPGFKFSPVTLVGPKEDEVFVGNNQPLLQWQPVELGEGEYYAVRMVYPYNGQPTYGGINTTETQWTVPLQLYQQIDPPLNRYEWYVIVERSQDEGAIPVSPESERRHFIWR